MCELTSKIALFIQAALVVCVLVQVFHFRNLASHQCCGPLLRSAVKYQIILPVEFSYPSHEEESPLVRVKESKVRIEKDSEQEETYLLSTPSVMVLGQRHVSAGPGTGAKPIGTNPRNT